MSNDACLKTVSVARCENYDRDNVCAAVRQAIDNIGGLGAFISPGQKVFLKFNMLDGSSPEKCVTTHPEVVYAVAKLLKDNGCKVLMGDSPGSGLMYNKGTLRKAYAVCGYDKIASTLDIPLNYDTGYRNVSAPESRTMKLFPIINPALDSDAVVVVSKAKTHTLTCLSGAAKNIFGVIPGIEKPAYHANLPDSNDFGRMIIDLNNVVKPKLQFMDAIIGMEGDGPHNGSPRKISAILASDDCGAIDVATCKLMSIEPMRVSTIRAAIECGCLREDLSDVCFTGEGIEEMAVEDYKLPSTYTGQGNVGASSKKLPWLNLSLAKETGQGVTGTSSKSSGIGYQLANEYRLKPVIHANRCISCMKCVRSCPVRTIGIVNKKPIINYKKCIKCYCCHEMCDTHAISLERSLIGKVFGKLIVRQ
jgi:Uncharacterized conserved protein